MSPITEPIELVPDVDYDSLTLAELKRRCAAAESVCVLFGWAATPITGERSEALTQAWQQWTDLVEDSFTTSSRQWRIRNVIGYLATQRRAIRAATLERLRGEVAK